MTTSSERRTYSRISSEVAVRWAGESVDKPLRDYLDQVARNVSLGGLFVDAEHPPPVGTLVKLELRLTAGESEPETILVTGLVRWRQKWSQPRGMGIEFIDFEGLGERDFKEWLETVLEPSESG